MGKTPSSHIIHSQGAEGGRRGRFLNSAFPSKKSLAQKLKFIYNKQISEQMLQKLYASSKQEKECYR